jgi:hypothetical protein
MSRRFTFTKKIIQILLGSRLSLEGLSGASHQLLGRNIPN